MVRPGTPGGDELRAVGEDKEHPGPGNAFQEILEDIFRGLVYPVQVLDGHDQGSLLGALQDDPFQGLDGLVLLPLGGDGDLLDAAVLDGEKLQEIGQGGPSSTEMAWSPCLTLFRTPGPNRRPGCRSSTSGCR